jgi:hypothetical protein
VNGRRHPPVGEDLQYVYMTPHVLVVRILVWRPNASPFDRSIRWAILYRE